VVHHHIVWFVFSKHNTTIKPLIWVIQLISRVWSSYLIWEVKRSYLSYLRIFEDFSKVGRWLKTHISIAQCIPFESNPCPFNYQHCALQVVLYRNKWVLSDLDRKWGQNIGTASGSIPKQPESKRIIQKGLSPRFPVCYANAFSPQY